MFLGLFMEGKTVFLFFACAHAPSAVRIGCCSSHNLLNACLRLEGGNLQQFPAKTYFYKINVDSSFSDFDYVFSHKIEPSQPSLNTFFSLCIQLLGIVKQECNLKQYDYKLLYSWPFTSTYDAVPHLSKLLMCIFLCMMQIMTQCRLGI